MFEFWNGSQPGGTTSMIISSFVWVLFVLLLWEVSLEIFFRQLIHTNSVHSLTDPFLPLVGFARSWILYISYFMLKKWKLSVSQEVARSFLLILKGWHSEGYGLRPHAMLVSCCLAEVRPRWIWCLLVESAHEFRNFLDSFIESYKAAVPYYLGCCLTFHQVKSIEKQSSNEWKPKAEEFCSALYCHVGHQGHRAPCWTHVLSQDRSRGTMRADILEKLVCDPKMGRAVRKVEGERFLSPKSVDELACFIRPKVEMSIL